MRRYKLSSLILLFLSYAFADNNKSKNYLKTTRQSSTEILGKPLLPRDGNAVVFEDNKYTGKTDDVRFIDTMPAPELPIQNVYKESKHPIFSRVSMNADPNPEKEVPFFDDLSDEVPTKDDQLNNHGIDFDIFESTFNIDIRQPPHKGRVALDFYSLNPVNNEDQYEKYPISEGSYIKGVKLGIEGTNSQHVVSKRVVFEEDNKNSAQELFRKRKKYKQPIRVPMVSGNIPLDPNIKYYGTEYFRHKNPYNIYPTYPQHSLSQNNPTVHSGQYNVPSLYPGQASADSYPVHPSLAGHAGTGSGYAAGYQGFYGPPHQQKTLAERAVAAVTEALTSIALYDDKQCVPRLLCEMSSGSTASSPTLLKATAALAPLLTLLQSYNVASSSPLFLFGRAAVLGISSKGHPATCRYAYPQCPTEPDKLTHYLNNHNGGFFRFFSHPKKPIEQNLGQLDNQQSNQYNLQNQVKPQSYYHPYYEQKSQNANGIDMDITQANIEGRIQNKPIINNIEDEIDEESSKWIFPDELQNENYEETTKKGRKRKPKRIEIANVRDGNPLKFPDELGAAEEINNSDEEKDIVRKQKVTFYPKENYFYTSTSYQSTTPVNLEEYVFDYNHNFYVKRPKNIVFNRHNNEADILYVVRGNGDPNHPEIVKVRPGQRA